MVQLNGIFNFSKLGLPRWSLIILLNGHGKKVRKFVICKLNTCDLFVLVHTFWNRLWFFNIKHVTILKYSPIATYTIDVLILPCYSKKFTPIVSRSRTLPVEITDFPVWFKIVSQILSACCHVWLLLHLGVKSDASFLCHRCKCGILHNVLHCEIFILRLRQQAFSSNAQGWILKSVGRFLVCWMANLWLVSSGWPLGSLFIVWLCIEPHNS